MKLSLFATTFLAGLLSFAGPSDNTHDSAQVNKLLADSKTEAQGLQRDAQELESFTRGPARNIGSQAEKLQSMKEHVNRAGVLLRDLQNAKHESSTWQSIAINRIDPALREMADNLQMTIDTLNRHPDRVSLSPYRDYATANSELATNLCQTVTDFVNYGSAKEKYRKLGEKLEINEP